MEEQKLKELIEKAINKGWVFYGEFSTDVATESVLKLLKEQLTLTDVGISLPDLAECNQASLDYATKKNNPDFFLIKQTFKDGVNWALNYVTRPK